MLWKEKKIITLENMQFIFISPYKKNYLKYKKVSEGFTYNSGNNEFYSIKDLRKIIQKERNLFIV